MSARNELDGQVKMRVKVGGEMVSASKMRVGDAVRVTEEGAWMWRSVVVGRRRTVGRTKEGECV